MSVAAFPSRPAAPQDERAMCRACGRDTYLRSDGVEFRKGDWLETAKGIGRFMGVWDNPTLGLTTELRFYRTFENPGERTSLFGTLGKIGGVVEMCFLNTARKVSGSLSKDGKRTSAIVRFPHRPESQ